MKNLFVVLMLTLTTNLVFAQTKIVDAVSKGSIKSCDQFLSLFGQKFKYAYDWPDLSCEATTENDSTFVITAHNPARQGAFSINRFFYQPKTDTVLQETARDTKVLRASNFLDASIATDMAANEFNFQNLPSKQQATVCSNIKSVSNSLVQQHEFRIVAGYEVAEIASAGNWNFRVAKSSNSCTLLIDVEGVYKGNSYRKTVNCSIGDVLKKPEGYFVKFIDVEKRCR